MNSDKRFIGFQCGCILLIPLINLSVGGWSVHYLLNVFFDKDIPWYGDALIGLFVAELSIPVAIVIALLQWLGAI